MFRVVGPVSGLGDWLGSGGVKSPSGAGEGRSCTCMVGLTKYLSPVSRRKSYIPLVGSSPEPLEVVCGGGAVTSVALKKAPLLGMGLPEKLTVPERSAVVIV